MKREYLNGQKLSTAAGSYLTAVCTSQLLQGMPTQWIIEDSNAGIKISLPNIDKYGPRSVAAILGRLERDALYKVRTTFTIASALLVEEAAQDGFVGALSASVEDLKTDPEASEAWRSHLTHIDQYRILDLRHHDIEYEGVDSHRRDYLGECRYANVSAAVSAIIATNQNFGLKPFGGLSL